MSWFLDLFRRRRLEDVLFETKIVVVHGVRWRIRKIQPIDYLRGAKVHRKRFDSYNKASVEQKLDVLADPETLEKAQEYYRDIFMSSVQNPTLCYAKDKEKTPDAICVDNLFTDWDLVQELHAEILEFSFGKKKSRSPSSPASK